MTVTEWSARLVRPEHISGLVIAPAAPYDTLATKAIYSLDRTRADDIIVWSVPPHTWPRGCVAITILPATVLQEAAALLGSVAPVAAQSRRLKIDDIGCTSPDTMAAVDLMLVTHRHAEVAADLVQMTRTGQCVRIRQGTAVFMLRRVDRRPVIASITRAVGVTLSEAETGQWFQYVQISPHDVWIHEHILVK